MEFTEKIAELKDRVLELKDNLQTEEATKNALILPLIAALGYDVFNPTEVMPEYVADVGVKKGEKVDYAIIKDNKPIILIECKKFNDKNLDIKKHATQLIRYFSVTDAKFIILTNGIIYKFFSDIESEGKLDNEPFFVFNLLEYKSNHIDTLYDFCKSNFEIEKVFSNAGDLKYIKQFEQVLENEYRNPSHDFVKYLIVKSGVYDGRITPNLVEKHIKTTVEAFNMFMSKTMKTALEINMSSQNTTDDNKNKEKENKNGLVTTIEELEGYTIIKGMLRDKIDINRVFYRDTINYFNIILDDNIRKTICRLYFNSKQKYIAFLENNKEQKYAIEAINDLYNFKDLINEKVFAIDNAFTKK